MAPAADHPDHRANPGNRCPLTNFHQAVGGKYKMRILWDLIQGPRRYGELRRSAIVAAMGKPVTPRVLSRELKELEARGLVQRRQYAVVPPRVEYSLSPLGSSLIPVLRQIVAWGLSAGRGALGEAAGAPAFGPPT